MIHLSNGLARRTRMRGYGDTVADAHKPTSATTTQTGRTVMGRAISAELNLRDLNDQADARPTRRANASEQTETVPVESQAEHNALTQIIRLGHLTTGRKAWQLWRAARCKPQHKPDT